MGRMTDSAAFVGRTSELAELDRALADARGGRGGFILVAGEPGIGKTTLCTCFCARALKHGARSLWGRAWEWGGAPPFWPWIQVFRALGGATAEGQEPRSASLFDNALGDRFGARGVSQDRATERAFVARSRTLHGIGVTGDAPCPYRSGQDAIAAKA